MSDATDDVSSTPPLPSPEDSFYFFRGISWTPQIEDASQAAALWINCDMCGASFWGLPRVGKSEFSKYFEMSADEMFGGSVVVIRLRFGGEQFNKPEQLLKRALSNLGVRAASTRELESLRTRLMDEIWQRCTPTTRRIVVIGDELQNVASSLYGEFAIMETAISERGYIPFLLCIGQPELQSTIANVEKNLHIMGRQFQELREFRGLSFEEVEVFLGSLEGDDRAFTRKYFPGRAVAGWSIVQLVEPIKQAVHSSCDLPKMNLELFFPMAYLRQTLNYLFFFLLDDANAGQEVTVQTVLEAFERNGFKKVMMSYVKPSSGSAAAPEGVA
jgi:hypothetical protein